MASMDGVLVFDGRCGMCTRVRNLLHRWDRSGRLTTEPHQRPGMAERVGVPVDQLSESVWWLDSSGVVFGGAEAFNAALSMVLGNRLPLWFYRVPGVRQLQEAGYRWIATHRYRFRGVTPLCESEPGRCS